jgi:hypothetical protein
VSGIEDMLVWAAAVSASVAIGRWRARVSGHRCGAHDDTTTYYNRRCIGMADPRCAGNQCTAHCRKHCKGKCLE